MTVEEYDVVVLGMGAAGLVTALRAAAEGAAVALFEKAGTVSGTTAWSGGVSWLPNNRHQRDLGGHGGTLGPALVFGLRAGRDAAARARAAAAPRPAMAPG